MPSPKISIIIPAFNEEAWLPGTLDAAISAVEKLPCEAEIIVVDNNSSDRTSEVARSYNVRVVFEKENGIARARNAGAKEAIGENLIFLDADTTVSSALLGRAAELLSSGTLCGGGAVIEPDKPFPGAAQWLVGFWNGVSKRMKLAAGCFIFCPRKAWEETGGFDSSVYASEEIWFSRKLKKWASPRECDFRSSIIPLSLHPIARLSGLVQAHCSFRWLF